MHIDSEGNLVNELGIVSFVQQSISFTGTCLLNIPRLWVSKNFSAYPTNWKRLISSCKSCGSDGCLEACKEETLKIENYKLCIYNNYDEYYLLTFENDEF